MQQQQQQEQAQAAARLPFLTTGEKRSRETRNLLILSWMSKKNLFHHLKQTRQSIHPSVTLRARPCKYPHCGCHNKPSSISWDFEKKAFVCRDLSLVGTGSRGKQRGPAKLNIVTLPIAKRATLFILRKNLRVSKGSF